ncbi:hypothetical protein FRC12_022765, partial [Ceratobasidium sp. 428]
MAPFLSVSYGRFKFTVSGSSLRSVIALEFREEIGGENKINEYCHSLAVRGGEILAGVLKTKVLESEKNELTAHMVNVQLPLIIPAGTPTSTLSAVFKLMMNRLLDDYNTFAS